MDAGIKSHFECHLQSDSICSYDLLKRDTGIYILLRQQKSCAGMPEKMKLCAWYSVVLEGYKTASIRVWNHG